jgi:hypothetical protein
MEMDVIQQLIGSYGFPIFVSVWLLWERKSMSQTIERNTLAIEKLTTIVIERG